LILRVEVDEQPVGRLWLALRNPRAEAGVGFINDISIDEALRGRGYGRAAMRLAEEEARRNGLHALALDVFGQNAIARGSIGGIKRRSWWSARPGHAQLRRPAPARVMPRAR
jgi:GNAT superfamily N-acetyltransferase